MKVGSAAGSWLSRICSLQNNLIEIEPQYRKWRRIHGFELPLHPQQVISWFLMLFLLIFTYLFLIPDLPEAFSLPVHITTGITYLIVAVSYIAATLVDPAAPAIRGQKSRKPVPEFDRAKHLHVIENGRCHLCNITVLHQRTKHCSLCNKCVDNFDHHCRWLNQCIGGRNYALFVITVVSSIIACTLVVSFSIVAMVRLYSVVEEEVVLMPLNGSGGGVTPSILLINKKLDNNGIETTSPRELAITPETFYNTSNSSTTPRTNATILPPLQVNRVYVLNEHRVPKTILYVSITFVCVTAIGMLLHLLGFHIYIGCKGLTTYEYLKPPPVTFKSSEELSSSYPNTSESPPDDKFSRRRNGSVSGQGETTETKGGGGDSIEIEQGTEDIWSTMTEIDLHEGNNGGVYRKCEVQKNGKNTNLNNGLINGTTKADNKQYFKSMGGKLPKPYRGLASLLSRNTNKINPNNQNTSSTTTTNGEIITVP